MRLLRTDAPPQRTFAAASEHRRIRVWQLWFYTPCNFFTIENKGGIILNVKRKLLLITTLAAVTAATIAIAPAYAAESTDGANLPEYPTSFVRTLDMSKEGLTDYAVNGTDFAFAVQTKIYVITNDERGDRSLPKPLDVGTQIISLDYAEGKLYYKTNENAYCYPDKSTPVEHSFQTASPNIEIGDNLYLLNNRTELKLFNRKDQSETVIGEGFSNLKEYGGTAYAVKNNCPYALDGQTAEAISLEYTDFSAADSIASGNIPDMLKANGYAVKTAVLTDGSYYTQIDAENIGETFKQVKTDKANGAISCIVLAEEGNLSVISAGGNCYVTATDSLTPSAYSAPANDWAQGSNGQRKAYLRERTGIYSCPYMCAATRIAQPSVTSPITVNVQEKFALDFVDTVFYRISYTGDNGSAVTGFVAAAYLDQYDYSADANEPTVSGNEGFSYDNNIATVILVLVIVGLVIIAIVYLTVVGTRGSKEKKGKKRDTEE